MRTKHFTGLLVIAIALLWAPEAWTQARVTTPKEQFGFNIGDDYQLANYTQLLAYWKKLDQESERLAVVEVGKTAEGRPLVMGVVTSPENQRNLAKYRDISRRLALAEGLNDDQARALAAEGKVVVAVYGGIHANEVLGAQQLIETVYQLVSRTDAEATRFLNDTIALFVPINPDGMEIVSNWYMREPEPTKRTNANLPVLYHKYVGHDNNRDWFMSAMPENDALNRVLYREWFPQIVYTHHQAGPAGTIMFCAPFRDPFNYNFDPLVVIGVDKVAAAMHDRFIAEGKAGVTMRSGSNYSTWWNGGDRTSPYFHNMIGILTKTVGSPNPMQIPLIPQRQLPKGDLPLPITPQTWHFRQSIEYELTANWAILDVASRYRDNLLFNIYRMGRNSIERGSQDTWTASPRKVAALEAAASVNRNIRPDMIVGGNLPPVDPKLFSMLREPANRDPRGYIISADQPDFLTAVKFVNTLIKRGVVMLRATAPFTVNGKSYPAGSFAVKTAQAFRPHILDMFEPQDHPDDFAYPGGPPKPPYDSAGWTLAYLMGVKFDRVLDGFDGPFERITNEVAPPPGKVTQTTNAAGYFLTHEQNDAFIAVNRLLHSGEDVYWMKTAFTANGRSYPAGTHFVPAKAATLAKLQKLANDVGLSFDATASKPRGEALMLRPLRIGLWDRYGGSMPSGWTRFVLEKFEFPFTVVFPKTLDEGNLAQKFDVILFVDGGIPENEPRNPNAGPQPETIPAEYRDRIGTVTLAKTIPQLKKFLEDGGSILAIGGSTALGSHVGLPIMDALVERAPDGKVSKLPQTKFYVPGSVLQAKVDTTSPLAFGMGDRVDLFYDESPTFKLTPDAVARGVRPVAWFDTANPLRSGWAWGEGYLKDGVAVVDASVGKGKLFLYGPEILFRSQPHGTFKFLFNGIYYGRSELVTLGQ